MRLHCGVVLRPLGLLPGVSFRFALLSRMSKPSLCSGSVFSSGLSKVLHVTLAECTS